ncbi:MAG: hypothetical protein A2509_03660 [Candidatus Edwardsbacteria bacterium RIFOXYD12_FULL_50_11]|uniref:Uncharacterized protein n=1 Tax=Candidatus Edwardsbacteria bacterium GWF2_54_11 TaxID=1817851 RepID=A0A1F5R8X1_9BACT|nr:MAG: hypothetical protein A2502_03575 [Candidatus Edwardsbacteria bacterium RifOxyC12_full_54_24]OGF07793.1 MAG: hypothetical protein A2273_04825 [Candidatus Edwardsbacteria bacterium RifOxyA12_full_54_48]OGF10041.1 MAG: hypothetical protein A3K15_11235 [Candidatus Edwardsbacteria bacterium GWE2_54_12]OGF10491.1 MAG: hypothetical protein A2024_09075 [Candidatus Edwardsbacteria bacterium GWF2_54_11]OGF14953.1 MAG: hypothetical protein A2509_03660 [Candidatus Edwardsbacteria bacterium RIFOXYD1
MEMIYRSLYAQHIPLPSQAMYQRRLVRISDFLILLSRQHLGHQLYIMDSLYNWMLVKLPQDHDLHYFLKTYYGHLQLQIYSHLNLSGLFLDKWLGLF